MCPMPNPPPAPPHTGLPVLPPGDLKTKIKKKPAARVSDKAGCSGPPDIIIAGAATVLISSLPAARQLDNTAHGGMITMGEPTVVIGGPQFVCPFAITYVPGPPSAPQQAIFGTSIIIDGSPAFQSDAIAAYVKLSTTPSGRKMIYGIESSGNKVWVMDGRNPSVASQYGVNTCTGANGGSSVVSWDPGQHSLGAGYLDSNGKPLQTGSEIILGHESVHAYHNATGTDSNGPIDSYGGQQGGSSRGEERATVGTKGGTITDPSGNQVNAPDHSADTPTENSMRRELGLPERDSYYPTNWPGGAPW
jgi:uncharacterized Zn-binding protein involved in type VI secretion